MKGKKAGTTSAKKAYEVDEVIRAIERARGKITYASSLLDCSVQNIYYLAKKHKRIQEAIDHARANFKESVVDVAEIKLAKEVNDGKRWAVKYALDTLGRDRGYMQASPQINIAVSIVNNYPILPKLIEAMEKANMPVSAVFEKLLQRAQEQHQEALSDGA